MKHALATFVALSALLLGITWWALESGGVAIVRTRTAEGTLRSTHVWYVETDGEIWLEAGAPENGWLIDLRSHPQLQLAIGDRAGAYTAEVIEADTGHDRIRTLMRRKYGFRDRWVGLVFDTSRSLAVRLAPG